KPRYRPLFSSPLETVVGVVVLLFMRYFSREYASIYCPFDSLNIVFVIEGNFRPSHLLGHDQGSLQKIANYELNGNRDRSTLFSMWISSVESRLVSSPGPRELEPTDPRLPSPRP
ncbi:hypothetical protein PENTCL1PPCAC_19455, partial [Pristionchus entomophagus]